ncbi:MAG: 5-formyltetrahydrofolate cyclo-ligase [Prevotella sp.]
MFDKHELRKIVRQRKREFSQQQLAELSLAVIERLKAEPHFAKARTVMLYCSLPDEVDTTTLLRHTTDKTILLPKVTGETTMELRLYENDNKLEEGAFHIMEPQGQLFTDYDEIEVAVVPGMAFDSKGNRLGRGKGYYDRFLSQLPPYIYKIGVCFDFQKFDEIPADTTDVRMDIVI